MNDIRLSLVIATYNRGAKLPVTLDSIAVQTLDRALWEVVVVNNNSTDDTAARFDEWLGRNREVNARMVCENIQGVSAARNRGVAESRGEYIVVIDDDETVSEDFLKTYFDLFESRPDVAAAGGKILPHMEGEVPEWMSPYTERAIAGTLDLGDAVREFPEGKFFGGGNHGYRRSLFDECGGYDTSLGRTGKQLLAGEEKELYMRWRAAGARIVYLPDAVIYHSVDAARLTREYFTRLCLNIGRSERLRTRAVSRAAYFRRLAAEAVKWCGVFVLSAGYILSGQPSRAGYLFIMRRQISRGLLGR